MPLTKQLEIQASNVIYSEINTLIDRYIDEGLEIYNIERYFKIKSNFNLLLNDINYAGRRYFEDGEDYHGFVKRVLNKVILDKKSEIETMKLQENRIIKFDDYLKENVIVPDNDLTIEYLFNDIEHSEDDKDILSSYFKTNIEYIESKDDRFNVYSISDFKTDILKNNRISFDVLILAEHQIQKIRNNIIKKVISGIFSKIPDNIEYMGVKVKPHTLMNKNKLKDTIDNVVNINETLDILSNMTKYKFLENYNSYYIWKKEN